MTFMHQNTHTHTHTHARTHARTHAHTQTHTQVCMDQGKLNYLSGHFMTDIQSASSVSQIKSHFLHEGSAQLRRQLPQASAYCFKYAIFGCCICWSINCPAFPGAKKGIFLSQRFFPESFLYV